MKKVKATLLTLLLAFVAVAITVHQFKPAPQYYTPLDAKEKTLQNDYPDRGIRGAIQYWTARKANQFTGIVDVADLEAAKIQAAQLARNKSNHVNWESMGPDNVGGRTRAFVIDKDDNRILYSGGVSSGFFKSTNQGQSWRKTDITDNQMIVSMIQTSDGNIYYGTGEQFFARNANGNGNSGFMGNGIYVSTDRGETFSHLPATSASADSRWSNVNMLADDPRDPEAFYAATMNGLMKTEDGGQSFQHVFTPPIPFSSSRVCSDLRISPDGQTIFAVFQTTGQNVARLYRSTDYGASFELMNGISTNLSRLVVAIAPSDPNYVYASAALASNNKLERIYRSTNNGDTWEPIGSGSNLFHPFSSSAGSVGQGDYDNIIAVDPRNPNRIFLGGVHLHSWSSTQGWLLCAGLTYFSGAFQNDNYVHADKHNIVFDTSVDPYIMYVTSDGGIAKSVNAQNTSRPIFGTITKNYVTTQFYSVAGSLTGEALGGTQDNGTISVSQRGLNNRTGDEVMGGDGGYSAISKINSNIFFAETQYGGLVRSLDRGESQSEFWDARIEASFPANEYKAPFVTPFNLWEDWRNEDTQRTKFAVGVYSGIWMTEEPLDFGKTPAWYNISPGMSFNQSTDPTSLEFTPDGDAVFFGSGSRLYRISGLNSLDLAEDCDSATGYCGGNNLKITQVFSSPTGQQVNGFGIDPSDGNRIVVGLGNYGNSNYVYITDNALDTVNPVSFTNITADLPRVPVYDAIISASDPSIIMLGTELGVYATYDATSTGVSGWVDENGGEMDIVPVMMIDQVEQFPGQGPIVYIATHGRGIYKSSDLNSSVKPKTELASNLSVGPNPANGSTTLRYELAETTELTLSVFDMNGRLVNNERLGRMPAGNHQKRISTADLKNGIYFVTLTGDGLKSSVKLMVSK